MFLPKPTEGGDYTPPPTGTHAAICIAFIDLGTQKGEYQGEAKEQHKIMIQWELPHELMPDGRPFVISKKYTWSMHAKSTLRAHLAAWRGRDFTDDDFDGPKAFNIANILGKSCTVNVASKNLPDGKQITYVSAIGAAMKGVSVPAAQNRQTYIALTPELYDPAAFGQLSDRMKEIVASSPEYADLQRKIARPGDVPPTDHNDLNDDIPF